MTVSLRVAVAQPRVVHGDLPSTAAGHAEAIKRAQAQLVIFPELSMTGYVHDAPSIALNDPVWDPIIAACTAGGTTALVGAPITQNGQRSIAVVAVNGTNGEINVAYRKIHLHGAEVGEFAAGPGPKIMVIDGWRVGMAVCRDTGIEEHTAATAALGIDLYAAGVIDTPELLPVIRSRAVTNARVCNAPVAVASAAGPVGPRHGFLHTAGGSAVHAADGSILVAARPKTGEVVAADLERTRY